MVEAVAAVFQYVVHENAVGLFDVALRIDERHLAGKGRRAVGAGIAFELEFVELQCKRQLPPPRPELDRNVDSIECGLLATCRAATAYRDAHDLFTPIHTETDVGYAYAFGGGFALGYVADCGPFLYLADYEAQGSGIVQFHGLHRMPVAGAQVMRILTLMPEILHRYRRSHEEAVVAEQQLDAAQIARITESELQIARQ